MTNMTPAPRTRSPLAPRPSSRQRGRGVWKDEGSRGKGQGRRARPVRDAQSLAADPREAA